MVTALLRSPLRVVGRLWQLISHNPLWSTLIATVVGGLIVAVLLGGSGSPGGASAGQTQTGATSSTGRPSGPARPEQAGAGGARTFANPYTLAQPGPPLRPNQRVQVECRVYEPQPRSVTPDGFSYLITSPPWSNRYWAPANSFWNGDVPGRKPYTHNTDFSVPVC